MLVSSYLSTINQQLSTKNHKNGLKNCKIPYFCAPDVKKNIMASTNQQAYRVFGIRDYSLYFTSRTSVNFAITMLNTVIGWQVYAITHNVLSLGLVGLAEFLPAVSVALIGGYFADTYNRRYIIIVSEIVFFLCVLTLLIITTQFESFLKLNGLGIVYTIIGLTGLVRGFLGPAQSSFAAQTIPPELFVNASTWNTTSWHLANIGGPAIGGLLYALSGNANLAYITILVLISFALVFISQTKNYPVIQKEKVVGENFIHKIREGLHFVFSRQLILGSLALDMFAVLFGGAVAMLPAYAKDILFVGPEGLGFMRTAPALGALLMSGILAYYPLKRNAGQLLLFAVSGFGICTILFGLSHSTWLSILMLAGTGFFDNISMVVRGTIVQKYTPNAMRGRVSAVNALFVGSSNELGAFESGVAANYMGLIPSVVFGGVMTIVVVVIAWFAAPQLRKLDFTDPSPIE